jgi:hypothetical protein
MKTLGQIAYEAYWNLSPVIPWEKLLQSQQVPWERGAKAVAEEVMRHHNETLEPEPYPTPSSLDHYRKVISFPPRPKQGPDSEQDDRQVPDDWASRERQ